MDHQQAAPIGFLWMERAGVELLGPNELVLRLPPLLAGIVSLFLFYWGARLAFGTRVALLGLGILSITDRLIYYSAEVKQYSTDVAICLILLLVAQRLLPKQKLSWREIGLFASVGIAAPWFSHPSVLVLAGTGTTLLIIHALERRWREVRSLLLVVSCWLASFALSYKVSLSGHLANDFLVDYWRKGFAPEGVWAVSTLRWHFGAFFLSFDDPGGFILRGLAGTLFLLGAVLSDDNHHRTNMLWISPVFFTLAMATAHYYPFNGRLVLFLVPIYAALIAIGTDKLIEAFPNRRKMVCAVLLVTLLADPAFRAATKFVNPQEVEDARAVLAHIENAAQPGDILYLHFGAHGAFGFYGSHYDLSGMRIVHGIWRSQDRTQYRKDLSQLAGMDRVWVLFTHTRPGEDEYFLSVLDEMGTQLDVFRATGAAAYLYQLPPETEKTSTVGR